MKKKYFFGWGNFRWAIKNIILVYSGKKSYFSKKRLESGLGFVIAEWGMVFWLVNKHESMVTSDFAIWASIQFFVAGYIINQIEKSKVNHRMSATITATTSISADDNGEDPYDESVVND